MNNERMEGETLLQLSRRRLDYLQTHMPDTISTMIQLEMVSADEEENEYVIKGHTQPWMTNFHGTLHGGICATFVDQAMGHMAFCLKPAPGITPTVDMNIKYHRPLLCQGEIMIYIQLVSRTKNLMHMSCQVYRTEAPEKVCITAEATYFYKPAISQAKEEH